MSSPDCIASNSSTLSLPADEDEEPQFIGNGLILEGLSGKTENLWDYDEGGHLPVHLEDCLGDDKQYRVLLKLGNGGYANVWLCRVLDRHPTEYVALKILMADASGEDCPELQIVSRLQDLTREMPSLAEHLCLPLDQFRMDGPNGSHLCLVYPLAGPEVCPINKMVDNPDHLLRSIARQAAEAMAALHRAGICHGDFRPPNILLRANYNGMSEDEILEYFEHPFTARVVTHSGEQSTDPRAPAYLVYPVEYGSRSDDRASDQICVIDFGESYKISNPPGDLGIPLPYTAPEVVFDKKCGPPSDIWALACTLLEIRTGSPLFSLFDDDKDEYLFNVVQTFGPFPEPWWSTSWEQRRTIFPDEPRSPSTRELRTLRRVLSRVVVCAPKPTPSGEDEFVYIPEEEQKVFADLLEKMFQYDIEKRLSAEEVLQHPWFSMEFN
ncbi:kinase-like protein [Aspergillus californicus]